MARPTRTLQSSSSRREPTTRLTKKEVLALEELLGQRDYPDSITKLKMRVGLVPQQSPPRPYAVCGSKSRKATEG